MDDMNRSIAEVAIAVLMDRKRQGVASTDMGNGVYRVSYVRESDGILFTHDAKVVRTMKGQRVLWRVVEDGFTGRWRDDKRDEIIIPMVERQAGMIRITIRQRGCRDVFGRESIK